MTGNGVIILTDMFGGTPSNLAISVMPRGKVEVLAGVNLPMLVKLARVREEAALDKAVVRPRRRGANTSIDRQPDSGGLIDKRPARTVRRDIVILNSRGLHARASAKFVKCAEQFDAAIDGQPRRPDRARNLDHGPDDAGGPARFYDPMSRPDGKEAVAALEALAALIAGRFGEE